MIYFLLLLFESSHGRIIMDKELCKNISCDDTSPVCGIRPEGEGFRLKLFGNECLLLENGCLFDDDEAYGIIKMDYCENSFKTNVKQESSMESLEKSCDKIECSAEDTEVCAMRTDSDGFRIRIFDKKCQLWRYNCENEINFIETETYVCNGIHNTTFNDRDTQEINSDNIDTNNETDIIKNLVIVDNITLNDTDTQEINSDNIETNNETDIIKNLVIVDNFINFNNNINESIDNFFAATHVFDMPLQQVTGDVPGLDLSARRMRVHHLGPVAVFQPYIKIPKNISDDVWHKPLIFSCLHRCPKECPATYAPVCGKSAGATREPVLTFQNHCFMDAAQCKITWEKASGINFVETSFLFCLGDELNAMYRFLPLLRTLQHMGRLKKKGRFRYKFRNLRYFNNYLANRNPKFMG